MTSKKKTATPDELEKSTTVVHAFENETAEEQIEVVPELEEKKITTKKKVICFLLGLLIIASVSLYVLYTYFGPEALDALGLGDEVKIVGTIGTCRVNNETTSSNEVIKAITYNIFLINCPGICQVKELRAVRVARLSDWFANRDEDIVMFQEVWSFHDEILEGMSSAGYCHYVKTEEKYGSGLALFSRYPIEEYDFVDYFDAFGVGDSSSAELFKPETYLSDKGILYAKIKKNEQSVHVFNTHTQSDSLGDDHDVRVSQFNALNAFIESKQISKKELVLVGGDMNEDMNCSENECQRNYCENQAYYKEMLDILSVSLLELTGTNNTFTYNSNINTILQEKYASSDCQDRKALLDYILYRTTNLKPQGSSTCEVIQPVDPNGKDLSDHFPMSCTYYL